MSRGRAEGIGLEVPADHPFGLANLPYGVYSAAGSAPRVGTRLGDHVVDLALLLDDDVFARPSLNSFMAQGYQRWVEVRAAMREALAGDVPEAAVHDLDAVTLHLPIEVADYVDFYASEQHATNVGRIIRPERRAALQPNWKHLPVGYHGRSSSIVVSGTDIVRPRGQYLPSAGTREDVPPLPEFGPTTRLDLEAEIGFVVGTGNAMGTPIPVDRAERHLFGVVLFNDWSARDIQAWEYVPLGPNLGKSFASTISPWVVPLLALEDARVPTPRQDPPVLPHLALDEPWGLDISLEVEWNGEVVSRPPYATTYWSPAQMLAHLTSNGAPTRTGDLFASGTVSGAAADERGSLIELSWGGATPVRVNGESRTYLVDGDEIVLRATAPGSGGTTLGFGEARGRIVAAS